MTHQKSTSWKVLETALSHLNVQSDSGKSQFDPEAKSRGGILVACAYIKNSTYGSNMLSVY